VLCAAICAPAAARANDDSAKLKERFKQRHPQLVELKDGARVGETTEGYVDFVQANYSKDRSAKKLVEAENRDRRALYALIAKKAGTAPETVAKRNARRNFNKAKPHHYLKLRSGKWVQKKALEK
jgi:uncharacterized protein YdbL (DUF1318 family)